MIYNSSLALRSGEHLAATANMRYHQLSFTPDCTVMPRNAATIKALEIKFAHCIARGMTQADLDWAIIGGESGPGNRPVDLAWMRSIRDQCQAAGVPLFVKQIDKRIPIPDDLRIRQWPKGLHD